jgi:hypothetical protein
MKSSVLTAVAVGVGLCVGATKGWAQTKATTGYMARLVPGQCLSGGVPAPCNASGITFSRGEVHLSKLKQSQLATSTFIGRVFLQDVSPPQTQLDARLSALLSYGRDPDGTCPLANTQVTASPWATSSMVCMPASSGVSCRGDLQLTALIASGCTDVDVVVEDVTLEVYESGFAGDPTHLIARDGQTIIGRIPDCDSGGSGGCP